MADKEKDTAALAESSKEKKPVKEKVPFTVKVKKFLKDYKSEIKKVAWPNRDYVIKNTGIVVVAIIAIAALVGVLDLGFTAGLQFLADII